MEPFRIETFDIRHTVPSKAPISRSFAFPQELYDFLGHSRLGLYVVHPQNKALVRLPEVVRPNSVDV